MLISGRIARYEDCLLPMLIKENKYEIHLHLSINDYYSEYYDMVKKDLFEYLKTFNIEKFKIPKNFLNENKLTVNQIVEGIRGPHNQLSMFYNDKISMKNATSYADQNDFEYDAYLKFRPDIIAKNFPFIETINSKEFLIHSAIPYVQSFCPVVDENKKRLSEEIKVPWVCDAIAYGNRMSMIEYCNTYDYVIRVNSLFNYPINFEPCLTQSLYSKSISIKFFKYKYLLDKNRRVFDKNIIDERANIKDAENQLDILDYKKFYKKKPRPQH